MFGRMVGDERQGWAILAAMGVLFLAGVAVAYWAEAHGNPLLTALGLDRRQHGRQGGPLRHRRLGPVRRHHHGRLLRRGQRHARQLHALGGMIPLINMQLGEIIVGGVGAGLYGMLLFVILAVFVAGLMVGRTPEYLGKKIEAREVKMAMLAILVLPLMILGFTARRRRCCRRPSPRSPTPGPHGFSEMLYAYTSATGNNGSAFAGLTGNTLFYNITARLAMLVGRFFMIVPMLAIAGSLAAKKTVPASAGTFPTTGGLFVGLLVGVDPDRRRPHLLPGARARPDRRASRDARRHRCSDGSWSTPWKPLHIRKRLPASPRWLDPEIICAGDRLGLRQARPARS